MDAATEEWGRSILADPMMMRELALQVARNTAKTLAARAAAAPGMPEVKAQVARNSAGSSKKPVRK